MKSLDLSRFEEPIRVDARLVEEAVLLAIARVPVSGWRRFHAARDPIYELEDANQREERFAALHAEWFDCLGLAGPLLELLAEQPTIGAAIAACLVAPAVHRKDEHADLREVRGSEGAESWHGLLRGGDSAMRSGDGARRAHEGLPVLVIQLLPTTLVDRHRLESLLRCDLYYVADMLDPIFGYDPELAVRATSGPLANLLRERHELLWRLTVDGRLAAAGHLGDPAAQKRRTEELRTQFKSAFPDLATSGGATFEALFKGSRPSHRQLMDLALHPAGEAVGSSGSCPLCQMPTPRDELRAAMLPAASVDAVKLDFPGWRTDEGLCPHCADLYELRRRI